MPEKIHSLLALILLLASLQLHAHTTQPAPAAAGVVLTLESPDGKVVDHRESRLIALAVPKGSPASPMLVPGSFRATFRGAINLKLRDQYSFSAVGRGAFELLINGQAVLKGEGDDLSAGKASELIRLKKGANEVVVQYTAPTDGGAIFRLSWAEKSKPCDPIPPTVLTHSDDAALNEKNQWRAGRELVATMRCVKCHTAPELASQSTHAMPELSSDAPSFDQIGARLRPEWMAHWIADPHAVRPEATMPKVFHDPAQAAASARNIAAYLAKTGTAPATQVDLSDANIAKGTTLFTNLGCVACHTAPGMQTDPTRITLRNVKAKFHPEALVTFLKKPEAHYAWTRMPNFALSNEEATALAGYLLKTSPDDALPAIDLSTADATRGEELVKSSGCLNCHETKPTSTLVALPLAELSKRNWSRGCVGDNDVARGKAPNFAFNDSQRSAIRAFAKEGIASLANDARPEFAERAIRSLNCVACHPRDAQLDAWSKLDSEIALLHKDVPIEKPPTDQLRPTLTWVGDKLRTDWATKFIAGKVEYKPRPWLLARMPAFASRAAALAEGMSLQHGWPINESTEAPIDPELSAIGRGLAGRGNGFSCNQCHAINQAPALVPFDSPSPNFMHVNERLRKDFYHRWVRSPLKYQPGTKMPTYADADGKTAYITILEGDARKQFDAIWEYLRAGNEIAPPEQ